VKSAVLFLTILMAQFSFASSNEKHHGQFHGKRFFKMDTNQDEKVSFEEWTKSKTASFQKIDVDGDGFVTREEMKKHHKKECRYHKYHGAAHGHKTN